MGKIIQIIVKDNELLALTQDGKLYARISEWTDGMHLSNLVWREVKMELD